MSLVWLFQGEKTMRSCLLGDIRVTIIAICSDWRSVRSRWEAPRDSPKGGVQC